MKRLTAGAALLLATAGCASMSKEECVTADWRAIGYEDGAAGLPVSAVSGRRQACAKKAGVTVDMAAYTSGRGEGLDLYCRPSNGYAVGSRGGAYHGVCTGPAEHDFLAAFETGRQLYGLQSAVASIGGQIQQAQYDLRHVEHKIAETEVALVSPGYTAHERLTLLAELKTYSEEKGNIETALVALHRDHARAQDDLAAYQDHLAFNSGWRGAGGSIEARY